MGRCGFHHHQEARGRLYERLRRQGSMGVNDVRRLQGQSFGTRQGHSGGHGAGIPHRCRNHTERFHYRNTRHLHPEMRREPQTSRRGGQDDRESAGRRRPEPDSVGHPCSVQPGVEKKAAMEQVLQRMPDRRRACHDPRTALAPELRGHEIRSGS